MNNYTNTAQYVLDDICTLIKVTNTRGEYGERVQTESSRTVFCTRKSSGQSEYFKALQEQMRSEGVLVIQGSEYDGEVMAEYGGQRYTVYRTYELDTGYIELYLSERTGTQ